jgi:hypothetical protein
MEGFLSKLVGLILLFFLLIVAPVVSVMGTQDAQDKAEILNDTCEFMDMVTDKRSITQEDLDEFCLQVASHGIVADVTVHRLVRISTTDTTASAGSHSSYVVADDSSVLNVGDLVQVEINELTPTFFRRLTTTFLRMDTGNYSLSMAKMVK